MSQTNVLFISLNIVSIYTFSYEDYFTNKKEDIELKDKKGLKRRE